MACAAPPFADEPALAALVAQAWDAAVDEPTLFPQVAAQAQARAQALGDGRALLWLHLMRPLLHSRERTLDDCQADLAAAQAWQAQVADPRADRLLSVCGAALALKAGRV